MSEIYTQLDPYFTSMCQAETMDVYAKWDVGRVLNDNYPEGLPNDEAEKIAGHYHRRDHKELYRWRTFYEMYPDRKLLDRAVHDRLGGQLTWRGVRAVLLPKDTKDSNVVGGLDNQSEDILGVHEASTSRVSDYVKNGVPESQRGKAIASITTCIETSFEALRSLDSQAFVTLVDRSTDDTGVEYDPAIDLPEDAPMTPKQLARLRSYLKYSPCYVTGARWDIVLAHFPVSKGAGAGDEMVIPLSNTLHLEQQHQAGVKTFMERYGIIIINSLLRDRNRLFTYGMPGEDAKKPPSS